MFICRYMYTYARELVAGGRVHELGPATDFGSCCSATGKGSRFRVHEIRSWPGVRVIASTSSGQLPISDLAAHMPPTQYTEPLQQSCLGNICIYICIYIHISIQIYVYMYINVYICQRAGRKCICLRECSEKTRPRGCGKH